jgi:1,4-dihydroxy-2-naphthoyl-CoA synthase
MYKRASAGSFSNRPRSVSHSRKRCAPRPPLARRIRPRQSYSAAFTETSPTASLLDHYPKLGSLQKTNDPLFRKPALLRVHSSTISRLYWQLVLLAKGAAEGLAHRLVNHVVKTEDLMPFCVAMAEKTARNSMSAVAFGKRAMNLGIEMDLDKALAYEAMLFGVGFSVVDQKEGMSGFLEKRKPVFK